MRYPNAFKGVSRIYSAELLKILAAVMAIVLSIIVTIGLIGLQPAIDTGDIENLNLDSASAAAVGGTALITLLLSVASGVISIVAFILNIVGVSNASKDEGQFKSALVLLLFGLIFSSLGVIFSSFNNLAFLTKIFTTAREVCDVVSMIMILEGIVNLASNIGDNSTANTAQATIKTLIGVYLIIILAELVQIILSLIPAAATASSIIVSILAIAAVVLDIITYFIYLRSLAKAKKMLASAS